MQDAQLKSLRKYLAWALESADAHVNFDSAVADFPAKLRGARAHGIAHTAWQLLEHMRICQWDILEFSRSPKHVSPPFEAGYWPPADTPPSRSAWDESVGKFRSDMRAMQRLVNGSRTDLFARIPWGTGQTVLREALLLADHNAYHIGQLVQLRKALGAWPG